MAKKRFVFYIVFVLALFASLEAAVAKYTKDKYYLPSVQGWYLRTHTNLFGQYDAAEELTFYDDATGFPPDVVKVKKPKDAIGISLF